MIRTPENGGATNLPGTLRQFLAEACDEDDYSVVNHYGAVGEVEGAIPSLLRSAIACLEVQYKFFPMPCIALRIYKLYGLLSHLHDSQVERDIYANSAESWLTCCFERSAYSAPLQRRIADFVFFYELQRKIP
jgi:hypothetical protein